MSSMRVLWVSVVISAVLAAPAASDVFTDDFAGGIDGSYWSIMKVGADMYSVDDTQGDVRFAKVGGPAAAGMNQIALQLDMSAISRTGSSVAGDFEVQVDFSDAVLPGPGLDQLELHTAYADSKIFYDVRDNDGVQNVHVWTGSHYAGFPTDATAGTLRIERVGSVITAYLDGSVVRSLNHTAADLTLVSFTLQNNLGSNDATSVTYDNFRIEGDDVIPEPASLFLLAAGACLAVRRRRARA